MRVDLHLHTTASDGWLSPAALVERVHARRVAVMAVTDHDTTAAVSEVQAAARAVGIEAIAGIEITAVDEGRDIHILGYFFDPADSALAEFLAVQRQRRVARVEAIGERLRQLGVPIAVDTLLAQARQQTGRSIGRPQVAQAMVAAGHVADIRAAFDLWLANDKPGFVSRLGPSIADAIAAIHAAGGVASLAHPGKTGIDAKIPSLRAAGLDAIEAYHSDHDDAQRAHYSEIAAALGCVLSGGSDFHGDPQHGREPGTATLPPQEWARLRAAAHRRQGSGGQAGANA